MSSISTSGVGELSHLVNCVLDDNRATRLRALNTLIKEAERATSNAPCLNNDGLGSQFTTQSILNALTPVANKLFSDPIERHRELSIRLISKLVRFICIVPFQTSQSSCTPLPNFSSEDERNLRILLLRYAPQIVSSIVLRFAQESGENSEELRLQLLQLLHTIVHELGSPTNVTHLDEQSQSTLSGHLDDFVRILVRALGDKFPDMRKEACRVVDTLALSPLMQPIIHLQAESLFRALLPILSHQHAKVRVEGVQAIGALLLHGARGLSSQPAGTVVSLAPPSANAPPRNVTIEDLVSALVQRHFDSAPAVRLATVRVSGRLLLEMGDRYSYWHLLMPLLLTGIGDELPDVTREATSLWLDAGIKFQSENEEELKEKLDFSEASAFVKLPPYASSLGNEFPGLRALADLRPNIGCKTLIARNMHRLIPAAINDMGDWLPNNRLKAAQLLVTVLWSGEEHATQYADQLVRALCRAATDETPAVRRCAAEAGRIGARVVEPAVWLRLVLPNLRAGQQTVGHLFALAALVNGTRGDRLLPDAATASSAESLASGTSASASDSDGGNCESNRAAAQTSQRRSASASASAPAQLVEALGSEEVLFSQQAAQQVQLLAVIDALLVSLGARADLFSFEIFSLLLTTLALSASAQVSAECERLLHALSVAATEAEAKLQGVGVGAEGGAVAVARLFERHAAEALLAMQAGGRHAHWGRHSPERLVLECLLLELAARAPEHIGALSDSLLALFRECAKPEKDAELRLKLFLLLSKILVHLIPNNSKTNAPNSSKDKRNESRTGAAAAGPSDKSPDSSRPQAAGHTEIDAATHEMERVLADGTGADVEAAATSASGELEGHQHANTSGADGAAAFGDDSQTTGAEAVADAEKRKALAHFAESLIGDLIVPNAVWHAGRTAAAVRIATLTCLYTLVRNELLMRALVEARSAAELRPLAEKMLQLLKTALEEDHKTARLMATRAFRLFLLRFGRFLPRETLHALYVVLLKRLDDSSDEIRIAATRVFVAYVACFSDDRPLERQEEAAALAETLAEAQAQTKDNRSRSAGGSCWYDRVLYAAHLEELYRSLLVHLDDREPNVQRAVHEALAAASRLDPSRLKAEIDRVRSKHRTAFYCDSLASLCDQQLLQSVPPIDK